MKLNINRSIFLKVLLFVIVLEFFITVAITYSMYVIGKESIQKHVEKIFVLDGKLSFEEYIHQQEGKLSMKEILVDISKKMGGGYAYLAEYKTLKLLEVSDEKVKKYWKHYLKTKQFIEKNYLKNFIYKKYIIPEDPFFDGKKSFGVVYYIKNTNMIFGGAISYRKAFAPVRKTLYEILAISTILILLMAIWIYFYLNKTLVAPIRSIAKQLDEQIKLKKLDYVKIDKKDEIGKLVGTLNKRTSIINELKKELEDTQKEIIYTMGAIGEHRSKETGNHVKRVAEYSYLLAIYYGLDKKEAEILKEASPMHDIGKVAIPDSILNKPAKLTKEEFEIMKTHAQLGYEMLKHSKRELLKTAAIVAYEHHEKWDGSGYPRGLKGEEIHIYGRITAVADVFDALGSDRVYKKAWDDEKIFNLFKEERAKHFDPKLIDIFFEHKEEFLHVREKFKDNI